MSRLNYCDDCGHYDWACVCPNKLRKVRDYEAGLKIPPAPKEIQYGFGNTKDKV